ncbi:calcium-binding protein [Halotia branconii]|uniref:Calcium-binding protein n=1 Tax=Halotia branconii CENA392 TaxID=1539056 RepID=A0AAJ6NYW8_9CYAN|nr:calcium-binding protein [Halotia branconii]WGV29018.1 calcium-binding protein [Halotia branconii CENA392]
MSQMERDENREERIDMEVVVDAYDEEERAIGWYYYLAENMSFPFKAKWTTRKRPEGRDVEVVEMSVGDDCSHDMFVEVRYQEGTLDDIFSARLSEINPIDVDQETAQVIADWHYWVAMGYEF